MPLTAKPAYVRHMSCHAHFLRLVARELISDFCKPPVRSTFLITSIRSSKQFSPYILETALPLLLRESHLSFSKATHSPGSVSHTLSFGVILSTIAADNFNYRLKASPFSPTRAKEDLSLDIRSSTQHVDRERTPLYTTTLHRP